DCYDRPPLHANRLTSVRAPAEKIAGSSLEVCSRNDVALNRYTGKVGVSRFPCYGRRLFGWLWPSCPWNLCLVHERKHDSRRTEERSRQFPSRLTFRHSHRVLRHGQFIGELIYPVEIALFPSPDFRPHCRAACDRCWS